jgi:integrase
VVRYLASLSVCMTYGLEDLGWLENNPVQDVRKPTPERGRVRFLSPQEQQRLLLACEASPNPHLLSIVIVALSTGARMSEILTLTWSQIDFKQKAIRLEHTKNGERRTLPLAGIALDTLKAMAKVRRMDTTLLFPRKDGKQPIEIRKHWMKLIKQAELENFRFHDLRHTAASCLAMNGASLLDISTILGHKTMAMVKRYAHLTEQHTHSVVERMNEAIFQSSEVNSGS